MGLLALGARNGAAILPDFPAYFYDRVDVALAADPSWDGETDQIHLRGCGEHLCADFHAADPTFQIEFAG